jgi:hypothetical protein
MGLSKRLHWAIALLPLVIITALSKSGHFYGIYSISTSSAISFSAFARDVDDVR